MHSESSAELYPHECPLAHAAYSFSTLPFLCTGTEKISFQAADDEVTRLHATLQKTISRGDRIALLTGTSLKTVYTILALVRCGAHIIFLNRRLLVTDWESQLRLTKCSLLISDTAIVFSGTLPPLPQISLDALTSEDTTAATPTHCTESRFIIFTSGSTGQGKGVVHSARVFENSARISNPHTRFSAGDCWLLSLPLYHVGGLAILYRALRSGGSVYLPPPETLDYVNLITSQHITHMSLVPTMLQALCSDLKKSAITARPKLVLLGGAPATEQLLAQTLQLQIPVMQSYGMTETGSLICATKVFATLEELNSVGNALTEVNCFLVDTLTDSHELYVRSPTLFLGYLNAQGELQPRTDEYFNTADLAQFNSLGNFVITGRRDRMFISGGENIFPEEIERVARSIPGVREAVVVPRCHEKWGVRPELFFSGTLTSEQVLGFLRGQLPSFKVPDCATKIDSFPRLASGKLDIPALQKLTA